MEQTIWIIGGDGRYRYAAGHLEKQGFAVKCWGVPGRENDAPSLCAALEGASHVLLPMKGLSEQQLSVGGETVEAALIPYLLAQHADLAAGQLPSELESWLQSRGVYCISLLEQEDYLLKNAYVTAEGAVMLALEHLERTLRGAKVLVIGWGRIGKYLSELLQKLGARVTVAVRRQEQEAALSLEGLTFERTGVYGRGLGDYDLICNTVPGRIMTEQQVKETGEDCVLMELATLPGGFPPNTQQLRKLCMAGGLPGKTAPKTAGILLAEAFVTYALREGRMME